jgi:hypothetical protein
LDPFWDSKPYVNPDEFRRFCAPLVPLARLSKRVFVSSDTLQAQIDVSHFGPKDLDKAQVTWSLLDDTRKPVRRGSLHTVRLTAGDLHTLGDIKLELAGLPTPAKYTLEVAIAGTAAVNDWDVWVYADKLETDSSQVRITQQLGDETLEYLKNGGKVLLAIKPSQVKTDVKLGFSPIFWNTAWTAGQPPHTLGVLCDPQHPALTAFPTEYHSNWQWSEPIQNAATMELDRLPAELQPIVQVVPDWFSPKKLALLFEASLGEGALMVCSVDIVDDIDRRPVERQLRHSLLAYMTSGAFRPKVKLAVEQLRSLFQSKSRLR